MSSLPAFLTVCGNIIYFIANDEIHGRELWKTDGTERSTSMVKNIWEGSSGSMSSTNSQRVICRGNKLLFAASDGKLGLELWETNGTSKGTHLIRDFSSGLSSSNPQGFTPAGNLIFFKVHAGIHGESLWAIPK
ncbi:MAG: hypothetical protein A2Y62_15090 [Candidatus Fischerbacteria bacterium RBG_13_37_8]|uniref:Hyalin n=1 Tax=Candidatus Fischerbacteria bacterium RBG_13_37_8 TaxID=1817863 RepID=A0A1F5VD77_9BACT|nr:MAG: hypothetical protein A2Y62_15090 [Candidatus Fischerbacteria bacterium RBG_13_37_8]